MRGLCPGADGGRRRFASDMQVTLKGVFPQSHLQHWYGPQQASFISLDHAESRLEQDSTGSHRSARSPTRAPRTLRYEQWFCALPILARARTTSQQDEVACRASKFDIRSSRMGAQHHCRVRSEPLSAYEGVALISCSLISISSAMDATLVCSRHLGALDGARVAR